MKKLDIYISKNFIKSFLLSLIAFMGIFILSQLFKIIKYITTDRMTIFQSFKYMGYLLPKIFVEVTPLAVLLGSLMCINKMASNLEIISLKTSGISFKRIVFFPIIMSIVISVVVFQIMNYVAPITLAKSRALKSGREVEIIIPKTKKDAFLRTDNNIVYYIKKIDRIKNLGTEIEIIKLNKDFNKIEQIITAKKGHFDIKKNKWIMKKVVVHNIKNHTEKTYKTYSEPELNKKPSDFITVQSDPKELTTTKLIKDIRDIRITGGDIKSSLSELGQRYSFPFASFIISFFGLALGSRYVRGASAINIALSVGFGYAYYIIQASFKALSQNGILNPFIAGWVPNIIFLCLGLYFMKKAEY